MNIENISSEIASSQQNDVAEDLWDAVEHMAQCFDVPTEQLARFLVDRIDKLAAVQNFKNLT